MKKYIVLCLSAIAISVFAASAQNNTKQKTLLGGFRIYASTGASLWATSLTLPDGEKFKNMTGIDMTIGADYGFGVPFGVVYSVHYAPYYYHKKKCSNRFDFVGFTIGLREYLDTNLVGSIIGGFGNVTHTDAMDGYDDVEKSGSGISASGSLEYQLTRRLTLGLVTSYFVANFGEADEKGKYPESISRIGASLTINCYF